MSDWARYNNESVETRARSKFNDMSCPARGFTALEKRVPFASSRSGERQRAKDSVRKHGKTARAKLSSAAPPSQWQSEKSSVHNDDQAHEDGA